MVGRDVLLKMLRDHIPEFRARYGVAALSIFGSAARGEATEQSDLDVLVEFSEPPTFDRYMDLKLRLEDMFGCQVDLVHRPALKPGLREAVEREALRVA